MDIVRELENKLSADEWGLVSYWVYKAASLAEDGRDDEARAALKDAVAVAMAEGESNAAYKVNYYIRFF